jgi:hypothetical protein
MKTAASFDIDVYIGEDLTLDLEIQNDDLTVFDLTGSELVWRIFDTAELVRATSTDAVEVIISDAHLGIVSLALSSTQTRTIPLGRKARYEIERRIDGVQSVILCGYLTGAGGVNDD